MDELLRQNCVVSDFVRSFIRFRACVELRMKPRMRVCLTQ
jgi:hypothetical protein